MDTSFFEAEAMEIINFPIGVIAVLTKMVKRLISEENFFER